MIGTKIGRYNIEEELGQGGMSVVYRGTDQSLERKVAVKVLHSHLAKKQENRTRLHREARAIARLKHPNILEIYDYSNEDAKHSYIVMEYIPGQNLKQFLETHGVLPSEYAAIASHNLCNALAHAHQEGIIHRDLKPENIMVSDKGLIKLMDFGIAHVFDAETMTQTGSLLGSPAHMAPEMIDGDPVDERSDIFALGTVMYWLVTGVLPFEGKNAPQVLKRVLEGLFKNPEAHDARIDQDLGDIIRKCLAHDPNARYARVEDVGVALENFIYQLGFEDAQCALCAYLIEPKIQRERFEAQAVSRLLNRANRALQRFEPHNALRIFNRILAYDPQNKQVQAQLQRMHQSRVRRHVLAATILCITFIGLGFGWFMLEPNIIAAPLPSKATLSDFQEQVRAQRARVFSGAKNIRAESTWHAEQRAFQETDAQTSAHMQGSRSAQHLMQLANRLAILMKPTRVLTIRTRSLERTKEQEHSKDMGITQNADMKLPTPKIVRWKHRFHIFPLAARVLMGDKEYSALALRNGIDLPQGRHALKITSTDCQPLTHHVLVHGPQAKNKIKPIVLQWQKGVVHIRTNTRALIRSEGKDLFMLHPGQVRRFVLDFGHANGRNTPQKRQTFQAIPILKPGQDASKHIKNKTLHIVPGTQKNQQLNFLINLP